MSRTLDEDLNQLKATPPDVNLDALELGVLKSIAEVREARAAARVFMPVQVAAVLAALGLGVVGGGFAAVAATRDPGEISAFAVHSNLAPSTLLAGHG